MDKKHFLMISGITLIALALAILLPGGRPVQDNPRLPWLIEIDPHGQTRVFGLTLGTSTLQQARQELQQPGEVSLFSTPEGHFMVEAYFQRLHLSGIRADMVLTLDLDQSRLAEMYDRGLRISQLESGAKKVKLAETDMASVAQAAIRHITYLPAADLDEDLIRRRFGEPMQRISEPSGVVHWIYPQKGLDIALNPDGKEIFQYISPAHVGELLKPLENLERSQPSAAN
ncbi:MAG: hypothetical protein KDI63_01915 [Gammaproteobacteria bacterium]|nr:hypothetical protein [Gammaproteobacteria bacterium]